METVHRCVAAGSLDCVAKLKNKKWIKRFSILVLGRLKKEALEYDGKNHHCGGFDCYDR